MQIRVTYSGVLKIESVENGSLVEVEEGTTISGFLTRCKILQQHHKLIVPIVNGESRRLTYVLNEGDQLNLLLPIGGG